MIRAAVVGASGYIGGELLRILLGHPYVEPAAAVSERLAGKRVDTAHPNLRECTDLRFHRLDELTDYDVLMLATPHGSTMRVLPRLSDHAKIIVDLSGDHRLHDPAMFERYYGCAHEHPEVLADFVMGCPELSRAALAGADRISAPGCMATAAILALTPLTESGLIEPEVDIDARTGSSGSGTSAGAAGQHAERSGALRLFTTSGHRHEAEIAQACGVHATMTATAVEAVRGVQVVCRTRLARGATESDIRTAYRSRYAGERFVRVVAQRRGLYRLPEPKILTGSNFCDVGFAVEPGSRRLLAVAALDNLVKGGAGNAVQALNVRMGWPESLGLEFPGLHPV
jgi:N-acetyl-gamma-glutamyl-phosphate/LysW-gamma-L-alpha-aminoadipyl-6-phosphate reductase